jgi:hypothetical protein
MRPFRSPLTSAASIALASCGPAPALEVEKPGVNFVLEKKGPIAALDLFWLL